MGFEYILIDEQYGGVKGQGHDFNIMDIIGDQGHVILTAKGIADQFNLRLKVNNQQIPLPLCESEHWENLLVEISGLIDGDNSIRILSDDCSLPPWEIKDMIVHWHN